MKPAPPVTRSRIGESLQAVEAGPDPLAPVRQLRRAGTFAAEDGVGRPRGGEMRHVRRRSTLVVDDRDLLAFGAEPEHRAHEVVAGGAEEPGAADDPRPGPRGCLAAELRPTVRGERIRAV